MAEFFRQYAPAMFANGWTVLHAVGKKVVFDGWSEVDVTRERVDAWVRAYPHRNVSVRCDDSLLAVDVDVLDEACSTAVLDALRSAFGQAPTRVGQAPKALVVFGCEGGGATKLQAHLRAPDGEIHKVEVLAKGQQFVCYGRHPDTGQPYTWTHTDGPAAVTVYDLPAVSVQAMRDWLVKTLPDALPAGWKVVHYTGAGMPDLRSGSTAPVRPAPLRVGASAADVAREGSNSSPVAGVALADDSREARALALMAGKTSDTLEDVAEILTDLDPDMPMHLWVQVGMALKLQFDDSPEALDLFDQWSARGKKYVNRADIDTRWRSFRPDGSRRVVTIKTLRLWARQQKTQREARVRAEADQSVVDGYKVKIVAATSTTEVREVCQLITVARDIDVAGREALSRIVQQAMLRLGEKVGAVGARVLVGIAGGTRSAVKRERVRELENVPDWCKPYVWSVEDDAFWHTECATGKSKMSFGASYNRLLMSGTDGDAPATDAVTMALNVWRVPVVQGVRYNPLASPCSIFEIDGRDYANRYRGPVGVDIVDPVYWSPEDEDAVFKVADHFRRIVPDENEREILLSWMAFCAQNPGQKIKWSPLLRGTKGDGKSVVLDIMACALGSENCKPIGPEILAGSDFSGWAEGACFVLFEELKLQGHNRYDVINKIKPHISNEVISIHRKGVDPYTAPNTQNYFATTNFYDAIPIDDEERRWFVLSTPFNSRDDLSRAGMGDAYFDDLFHAVKMHRGAIGGWLLNLPISPKFRADGKAPRTRAMRDMADATVPDDYRVLAQVLELAMTEPGSVQGVMAEALSSWHLQQAVEQADPRARISPSRMSGYLRSIGWERVERAAKVSGRTVALWARGGVLASLSAIEGKALDKRGEVLRATRRTVLRDMLEKGVIAAEFGSVTGGSEDNDLYC